MNLVNIVFKADDVLFSSTKERLAGPHSHKWREILPSGEYINVRCLIGYVDNQGYIGVQSINVNRILASQAITYALCKDCLSHDDMCEEAGLKIQTLSHEVLTDSQRKKVINEIQQIYIYWWSNTPERTKKILSSDISNEDRAKDILREGIGESDFGKSTSMILYAISVFPQIPGARCELGKKFISRGAKGDIDIAIKWFKEELEHAKEPDELTAYSYLAAIYQARGSVAEANSFAEAALQTKQYKAMPTKLAPSVFETIRLAVEND